MVLERLSWHLTCTNNTSSSALMLFVLLVMIFLLSVLTSFPYAIALSTSLLVRSGRSLLLLPRRSMLSANHRLHMGLSLIEMDMWWSWSVSCMIFSWNKLNRMGRVSIPDGTPTIVLKSSPCQLFKRTAQLEFSYSAWMA